MSFMVVNFTIILLTGSTFQVITKRNYRFDVLRSYEIFADLCISIFCIDMMSFSKLLTSSCKKSHNLIKKFLNRPFQKQTHTDVLQDPM